ncbi:PLP-dependent aminotransferase family protein [Marinomonas mediterranea]|uniref:Transcriptional regulator, GntR family with aminotransferase domain n=1 Tax=Marinomonas mediterranea (strain ATCC 700492 / JCM 21426 / NBRC 103028 / MMB-1) TaxID=717774 RepID=F2JYI3_MARM1|nr:PLP-dependent aminotransferase family protein [Marinomonas mediterranea]ADZ93112.1 transcriptional regulator, GntR family with aminotransferase domain [Marinomonas mediterranea MMB-1]WCN11020.1 aminotransferase class I/II-fold pyridoxal phosphate-dependent enzyme [Marinomonas mediterranea]WCN19121.1 aminotransferase class I/II-fold pyridoxal phosphate-dependent enzyme [Marinomonas mediterranea MMB-1]
MSEAKFRTLARKVRNQIELGHYKESSKLPTHRALAKEYGTTPMTAAKAYQLLAEQGHIESHVGRGSFVKKDASLKHVIRSRHDQNEWNFSILQPCLGEHLDSLNTELKDCFSNINDPALFGYIEETGDRTHKDAGKTWMSHYGLDIDEPEQVLLTNGAQHALSTLIQCYSEPGDNIAVEALTYPGILSIIQSLGRHSIEVEMDDKGMCPKALKKACREQAPAVVIVIPSHQNPTTITMPKARREALAKVINKEQLWLIEDDLYAFLNDEKIEPICNLSKDRGFYVSSLSKAISPGIRCGYIKTPTSQTERLASFIRTSIWLTAPLMFEFASRLIQSKKAFEYASLQKRIAESRQKIAADVLNEFTLTSQASSYHIWLTLPDGLQARDFVTVAKDKGLIISSGQFFSHTQGESSVRLSLMAIADENRFVEGLNALKSLLQDSVRT